MRVIILDKREMFLNDIQTRLLLDDRDIELVGQSTSATNIEHLVQENAPEYLIIADNIFPEHDNWKFSNCMTCGYITKKNGINPFENTTIPFFEYVASSVELLSKIQRHEYSKVQNDNNDFLTNPSVQTEDVMLEDKTSGNSLQAEDVQKEENKQASVINKNDIKERLMAARSINLDSDSLLSQELKQVKQTKTVAVYAAKGGVGKTTISAELAAYLSRISIGRDFLKVCIIDCNIDFGDVLTTLGFDTKGYNMTYWAAEVRERLQRGEKPDQIIYTKEEIEKRLQKMPKMSLYALIAPITHEDSLDIDVTELEIIFDNIIKNGDFDFVIFDTGNNTRDSSILALNRAEYIFMVVTQDVSTISCNKAFISTMKKINFDTNKIRIVFNQIQPYKITRFSVEEIKELFPYDCIAYIKRSPDIIEANNLHKPLVLKDPSHSFTKEIRKMAYYLLDKTDDIVEKTTLWQKFSQLFRIRR